MSKKGRSATQRWNRAVAEAHADTPLERGATDAEAKQALAAVLAMSDEEVARELRRAGVDLDAFDAESGREFDALMAKTGGATSEPEAAATAGVTTYLATHPPKETPEERPDASAKDAAAPPEPVPSVQVASGVRSETPLSLSRSSRSAV